MTTKDIYRGVPDLGRGNARSKFTRRELRSFFRSTIKPFEDAGIPKRQRYERRPTFEDEDGILQLAVAGVGRMAYEGRFFIAQSAGNREEARGWVSTKWGRIQNMVGTQFIVPTDIEYPSTGRLGFGITEGEDGSLALVRRFIEEKRGLFVPQGPVTGLEAKHLTAGIYDW